MAQLSPISPPAGGTYGVNDSLSPSILRSTFSNNVWFESSPESRAEPSPLRQPFRSMEESLWSLETKSSPPSSKRSGDETWSFATPGHVVLKVSQTGDGALPLRRAQGALLDGSQQNSSTENLLSTSPRIAACHAPAAQRTGGQQHSASYEPRWSEASEACSYFEWSVSSATLGFQPSTCLRAEYSLGEDLSHSTHPPPATTSLEPAGHTPTSPDACCPPYYSAGHLIAPAVPRRYLWTPSTDGDASSSPAIPSHETGQARQQATSALSAGPHEVAMHSTSAGCREEGPSGSPWALGGLQRLTSNGSHPIFELQREDLALGALHSPATASSNPQPAAAGAVATATDDSQSHPGEGEGGPSGAAMDISPHLPALPSEPPSAAFDSPPPPPPPAFCTSPVLPSSSLHRRHHSALPPSGSRQQQGVLEGSALERAWSVTGSHIDIKLMESQSSIGCPSACRAPMEASTPAQPVRSDTPPRHQVFSPLHPSIPPIAAAAPAEPPHGVGLPAGTYARAEKELQHVNISRIKRRVRSSLKLPQTLPFLQRLAASCFGPGGGQLRWQLGKQQLRLLSLSRMPYNADDPLHYSLMRAVLQGFAGDYHQQDSWRQAGFTSANPCTTDLSGCGVLGLLHLLLLLEKRPHIAIELHRASAATTRLHSSRQLLSPALISIHATLWTVQALRTGCMKLGAQRLKSTYLAAERFYLGAMDAFMANWKQAGQEVRHLQDVLLRTQQRALTNVWPMIQRSSTI